MEAKMDCRLGCSACCIAPSINSPIPGMEGGKPAGVACIQLNEEGLCNLFGQESRPGFCGSLQPSLEMCGTCRSEAMETLALWEKLTQP